MSGCRSLMRWCKKQQCLSKSIPTDIEALLFDRSSLTARLIKKCQGRFRVEVLSVKRTTPTPDEVAALRLRSRSQAIIRQVLLYCDDTPWVYARTVIPMTSLRGPLRSLTRLGTRPLGAVLFADKTMKRSAMEITALKPDHMCYPWTRHRGSDIIWGRRSVFWLRKMPLLVSEFFLPGVREDTGDIKKENAIKNPT